MTASDLRNEIPVLGLTQYWYPALKAKRVRNKPIGLSILGKDIVFFRGSSGEIAALANTCPHRGGSLKHGDCHYRGTVACPYHGWVFDESGECIAVLSEGPKSLIPGRVRARKYPTRTLRGLVFIWMGEGTPAPIEEDVPPEFFGGNDTLVLTVERQWPVNWRVALENSLDSHVMYVHRNAILMIKEPLVQFGRLGNRARIVNDRACIGYMTDTPTIGQEFYERLNAHWPKTNWRRLLALDLRLEHESLDRFRAIQWLRRMGHAHVRPRSPGARRRPSSASDVPLRLRDAHVYAVLRTDRR